MKKLVSKDQLDKLKNLSEQDLLAHTWIPLMHLDHIETTENSLTVVDCGNDINGDIIDNTVTFTTEYFEMAIIDAVFLDHVCSNPEVNVL